MLRVVGAGFGGPGPRDGQLSLPHRLRFCAGGSAVCVADTGNDRACLLRVDDGGLGHLATGQYPLGVEEAEGGWVVACW
ncbi:MAG: hypothetical protein ACK559_21835, partial [bacterium]